MLILLLATAAAALAVLLVAFAIGAATGRHRGVDVAWGVGFAAVASTAALLTRHPMSWLTAALTVLWGLRLAVHIGRTAFRPGAGEDPRYRQLLGRAKGNQLWYALRTIYLLQAVSLWFVALPVVIACRYAPLTGWAAIGIVLWAVGLFFEAVGDWQLARFREDPSTAGRVLDTGLWRYSRHPNYFGDACVWWGLFALAAQHWSGWLTILSPILMTYLLTRRTGKPLMEKHLSAGRPGYADYVARTSGFLPRPPRRPGARESDGAAAT